MPRRRTGFAKKIDNVHWTYTSAAVIGQSAGTTGVNLSAALHLPETLLRIRGEFIASIGSAGADARGALLAAGIIQVPEGTGTTVLWSPVTDGDAPWIWWDTISCLYSEMVADVIAVQTVMGGRRVVDLKAMRKLRNTELQLVFENTTIPGLSAVALDGVFSARFLAGS